MTTIPASMPNRQPLTPLRSARARSVMQFIRYTQSERKITPDVADVVKFFGPDLEGASEKYVGAFSHYAWTRHEVDTALNDLARQGYVRIVPDMISMEIEVLRPWDGANE